MPIAGVGIPLSLKALKTNEVRLLAGEIYNVPPGHFDVIPGPYTYLQFKDPVSSLWRSCKLILDAPPVGGIQATASAAISAGAITAVTIRDQGAGYVTSPRMYFLSDPRDPNNPVTNPGVTTGITPIGTVSYDFAGAQAGYVDGIATITGSGTIAAVVATDPGNAVTALPTLSFSGGGGASAAATVVMNWSITGFSVTGGGGGYSSSFIMLLAGGQTAATPTHANPEIEQGITQIRAANISGTAAAGAISGTGTVIDGGIGYQDVPVGVFVGGVVTTAGTATVTVGGQRDIVYLISDD